LVGRAIDLRSLKKQVENGRKEASSNALNELMMITRRMVQ